MLIVEKPSHNMSYSIQFLFLDSKLPVFLIHMDIVDIIIITRKRCFFNLHLYLGSAIVPRYIINIILNEIGC